jgi:osmotically inducible lipoprotein OsmE
MERIPFLGFRIVTPPARRRFDAGEDQAKRRTTVERCGSKLCQTHILRTGITRMIKQSLAFAAVLATLGGCATNPENPVDYVTYRHEPLVEQVKVGMTKEQALTLGGPASSEMARSVYPGSCNNYVLNHEGKEQPYYVAFDANDRVQDKGFLTCKEMETNERTKNKL